LTLTPNPNTNTNPNPSYMTLTLLRNAVYETPGYEKVRVYETSGIPITGRPND